MTSLAGVARGARRLAWHEWVVLAESALAAVAVEVALRCCSLGRIVGTIEAWPAHAGAPPRATIDRIARLVEWPYRCLPLPASCLRLSLVRVVVLRRRGAGATLRLGVRRAGPGLDAHAWVDCGGPVGDEPNLALYRELPPAEAAAGGLTRSARWST